MLLSKTSCLAGLFLPDDLFSQVGNVLRMDTQARTSLYEKLMIELGLTERDILAHLTLKLAELARSIGLSDTLKFIEHFESRQIYIPVRVTPNSELVQVMGEKVAARIIDVLGYNPKFDVNSPFGARFILRHNAVKALRDGASINEVATTFGVSRSAIKDWKRAYGLTREGVGA